MSIGPMDQSQLMMIKFVACILTLKIYLFILLLKLLEFQVEILDKKSFVTKLGAKRKNWKRRWMVLFDDSLCYFKKKEDSYPAGKMQLNQNTLVAFVDENVHEKKNCIAIVTQQRTYHMVFGTSDSSSCFWAFVFFRALIFPLLFLLCLQCKILLLSTRISNN